MSFVPYDRPVRAAFVGLGRIYDLNVRAYVDNPDVDVVALVDPDEERRAQRQADWPEARTFASVADMAASSVEVDAVEALLPIPLHVDGVVELLDHGWHVNLQKPMCNDLAGASRMLEAARSNDRQFRVMENYIFYQPLVRLKQIVESGDIGDVSGYHMKMVGSGLGGWEVPASSYRWQFMQIRNGRGILVFDDGWHKLATALWLFGPIREVRAWVGATRGLPRCKYRRTNDLDVGTREWRARCLGHHSGTRHVPPFRLLHERRTVGGNRPKGIRTGQPVHGSRRPTAEPRGVRRRRDAGVPRAR